MEADGGKDCIFVSKICLPNGLPDVDAAISTASASGKFALIGVSQAQMLRSNDALTSKLDGFLKGWELPRMNDDLKICGWALNSEYFSSIMHELRDDPTYRAVVDARVDVPERSDTRDTEAIKRICTAYLKLLFPNVQHPQDISSHDFNIFCLKPAIEMRSIIKIQLGILDSDEFGGKTVPELSVKDCDE